MLGYTSERNKRMDIGDEENELPIDSGNNCKQALKNKKDVDEACSLANQFVQLYYEIIEKKPHLIGQQYLENSVMIWDGNPVVSRGLIQKYIEQLPPLTFNMSSMDCQRLNYLNLCFRSLSIKDAAVGDKTSFSVKLSGQYRVSGVGVVKPFTQLIVLTEDEERWRVALDNLRTLN